jgi:carboxypeptidase Taq
MLCKKEMLNCCGQIFRKPKKFSQEFVEEMSMTVSQTFAAWEHAKKANDFSLYAPQLEKMIALKRKQAEIIGYEKHPYDALLDDYEPGMTAAVLDEYFNTVRSGLKPLLEKIKAQPQVDNSCLHQHFDRQQQWDYSIAILKQMGYDFGAGRQDISTHPFTTNFAATDVRVTTRINENDMTDCLFSAIHEGGHALIRTRLAHQQLWLAFGRGGIVECTRIAIALVGKQCGKSIAVLEIQFRIAQKTFPAQFSAISQDTLYKAINRVEPSFIRTQADELTYHFHIMIRFDIEKALMEGTLNVADLKNIGTNNTKNI